MSILSPFAGKLPGPGDLIDVARLLRAYEEDQPDAHAPGQLVSFGTSGHRGSSLNLSFNRNHILAMTQAICLYRKVKQTTGPLFLGFDTHALSLPAFQTALEVLAGNEVTVMIAPGNEFTPTPAISHAIVAFNRGRTAGLADGIVITPSHNPPGEGGFKYNPTHGGPADKDATDWIQAKANEFLTEKLAGVKRVSYELALRVPTTRTHDFVNLYVRDLANVIDMNVIRDSGIKMAVDPLGGAGVHYWQPIADFYKIDLTIINSEVDPTFRFMTRDWDGKIRMDPSSPYAMRSVVDASAGYDIAFACDTDHDRHGIVTKSSGLMPANHYLAVAIDYLFRNRPAWSPKLKIGKTSVSSQMIDRVGTSLKRGVYEVPVGFKWFVDGLSTGILGFAGEESAGATFLRSDGETWTTDKDAFVPALLSAEMTAKIGKDPGTRYLELANELGTSYYERVDAPATAEQKKRLSALSSENFRIERLGGEQVSNVLTQAPGNGASLGGIKIETKNGWVAVRPSGTENAYKIYAESFLSQPHLATLIEEAKLALTQVFASSSPAAP